MHLILSDFHRQHGWHSFRTVPGKQMPSAVIREFIYDETNHRLRFFFTSGLVYDYINVPKDLYDQLLRSFSKGKFLNEQIKGKYPFEKLGKG